MRVLRAAVISVFLCIALAVPAWGGAASPSISGRFTATVDLTSVQLQDKPYGSCLLTVNGVLEFYGSLKGEAAGTTNALEAAPCSDVAANPPGTYFDVFQFRGHFDGTVNGRPLSVPLTYTGITRVGGHIDAVIVLRGSGIGPLKADAVVAVGGTYSS